MIGGADSAPPPASNRVKHAQYINLVLVNQFRPIPGVSLCGTPLIGAVNLVGSLQIPTFFLLSGFCLSLGIFNTFVQKSFDWCYVFIFQDMDHHQSPGRFLTSTLPACLVSIQCSSSQTSLLSWAGLDLVRLPL